MVQVTGGTSYLFDTTAYVEVPSEDHERAHFPKFGYGIDARILMKLEDLSGGRVLGDTLDPNGANQVYAHRIASYFVKALTFIPHFSNERDGTKRSDDYKVFSFKEEEHATVACSVINSNIFYMYYIIWSDAYHCGRALIEQFPINIASFPPDLCTEIQALTNSLMHDLRVKSDIRKIKYKKTGVVEIQKFFPKRSKSILDEIDHVFARHFGFTEEELDFIINYDIKYRLGREGASR